MERFGAIFLIAGLITFVFGFFIQGFLPILTLRDIPMKSMEEITQTIPLEFFDLAEQYPEQFKKYYGEPNQQSFIEALKVGKAVYIAEGCWHCHSQFIRPVSNEDLRFGPVSTAAEYENAMNLPHLFGTRRVGPDLIRESGRHSNDWHVAHFYEPRFTSPYSVMPSYRWFFEDGKKWLVIDADGASDGKTYDSREAARAQAQNLASQGKGIYQVEPAKLPNKRGLGIVAYVQWLGSWVPQVPETIYNMEALKEKQKVR
ncbi:MAG: cbb3-type cytochrome c oxidase subunit II [bacterium]